MFKKIVLFSLLLLSATFALSQDGEFLEVPDGKIYFEVYGSGPPLLIINGGPGMSSEGFRSLAKQLGEYNRTIIYDQRGTGKSSLKEVNAATITMDKMLKDIEAIRTHLGIEKWRVMGHSFGGMLASYYASRYPGRISGLILSSSGGIDMTLFNDLNITGRLNPDQRDSLTYWNRKITAGDTTYLARYKRGTFLAPAYLYDKQFVPVIANRLTQGNRRVNQLVYENLRAIQFDCSEELRTLEAPVLIIQGKNDIIPQEIAETTDSLFKKSQLVLIENCAHYGWLEQPKVYFRELKQFLQNTKI